MRHKDIEQPPQIYITRTGQKITIEKLKGNISVDVHICYKIPRPGAVARNITKHVFDHYVIHDVTVALNKIVYLDMLGKNWSEYMYKGNFVEDMIRQGKGVYA